MFFEEIIKFINQIDNTINVEIEKDITKYGLACEPTEAKIYIGLRNTPLEEQAFQSFVNELEPNFFDKYQINAFILSILHEVGHIMTHEEEQEEEYNKNTNLLIELEDKGLITKEQQANFYARLTLEKWATQWAIDFCKLNKKFVRDYQNKIIKRLA